MPSKSSVGALAEYTAVMSMPPYLSPYLGKFEVSEQDGNVKHFCASESTIMKIQLLDRVKHRPRLDQMVRMIGTTGLQRQEVLQFQENCRIDVQGVHLASHVPKLDRRIVRMLVRQAVIVRTEHAAAAHAVSQVMQDGISYGGAVRCGSAAAQLVQGHQGAPEMRAGRMNK
jgi:hypothetical protein